MMSSSGSPPPELGIHPSHQPESSWMDCSEQDVQLQLPGWKHLAVADPSVDCRRLEYRIITAYIVLLLRHDARDARRRRWNRIDRQQQEAAAEAGGGEYGHNNLAPQLHP